MFYQQRCGSRETFDQHPCGNPVKRGASVCRDGHRVVHAGAADHTASRAKALVGHAGAAVTVDLEELLPPGHATLPEELQVADSGKLEAEIPPTLVAYDRQDSIGHRHPHLVPLWSAANPVSIFEVRVGGGKAPKWEWICPACSTPVRNTAKVVAAEWKRAADKNGGQGRLICRACLSTNAARRSRLAGLRRGTIATDPVMGSLWDESNSMPADQVSLKNSGIHAIWKCSAGIHPPFEKRVDHMRTALSGGKSGCVYCASGGFDKTKPGWMYLIGNPETGMFKVGISNDPARRLKEHEANGFDQPLDLSLEMSGEEAYEREQRMLKYLKRNGVVMGNQVADAEAHDGWSETWASGTLMVTKLDQLMRLAREDETARGIVLDD